MGAVIKSPEFRSTPAFSFEDLEQRARNIIARAQADARQITSEARAAAERTVGDAQARVHSIKEAHRREGYNDGFGQGRTEGKEQALRESRQSALAQARDEVAEVIQALNAGLSQFEQHKRHVLALGEAGLVQLAVAIARRVCKTLVERSPEPAVANARALLEMVGHDHDIRLHMNPTDHQLLDEIAIELVRSTAGLAHVDLVADPAVPRGGCVLQTRDGTLDADIAAQLDRIAAAICEDSAAGRNGASATDGRAS